jgi:asparagine synthase (glutamine-hydrolysing)
LAVALIMLSGGLDSRVVSHYANQFLSMPLNSFSVSTDGPESEGPAARDSATALGSRHHEISVSAADLAASVHEVAYYLDEPVADPAAFAVLKLCRYARNHVKVLLGGEGADELFAGYAGRYQGLMRQSRRSQWLRVFAPLLPQLAARPQPSKWRRMCYRVHRSAAAELIESRIEGFPCGGMWRWGLTAPQLDRLSLRSQELARWFLGDAPPASILNAAQSLDIQWQLGEALLLKSDKMSMAVSLELRCPFLDARIADVARRISPALRIGNVGEGKLVLRECLKRRLGFLPHLPKKGFPIPLDDWMRGPLRDVVHAAIFSHASEAAKQLDATMLRAAWDAFQAGEPLGHAFYALWLYEAWKTAVLSKPRKLGQRLAA